MMQWLLQGVSVRQYWRSIRRSLLVAVVAGIFLAVTGAFGTHDASLLSRLTFWVSVLLAGSVCATAAERATSQRPGLGESRLLKWLVLVVSVAAPMSLFSWGLAKLLFGAGGPSSLLFFGWATTVISSAMTALMMALNMPGVATRAPLADGTPAPVRFLERLAPPMRGAEIYAVAAEDHYLRVHTSAGSALILMRLGDAIAELDGIEGAQIHRSWWVARNAIQGLRREERRTLLVLKEGVIAPVSRPNVVALRAAGWISGPPSPPPPPQG